MMTVLLYTQIRKLSYYGHTLRSENSTLDKAIVMALFWAQ